MAKFIAKALAVKAAKHFLGGGNKASATGGATKAPWSPLKKLRLCLFFTAIITFIGCVLSTLLVVAGSKPGMLEKMSVFTLNVSHIGEGVHDKIDGAIAGINLDDLHVDLKRSAPVYTPASITVPHTTLVTMAPRDIGSDIKSLTDKAGNGIESADSAAHSKASQVQSQVQSKASSAANSVESSVNSGIDSAATKLKDQLTELVDGAFKDIIAKLDLQGFYSIHMLTTCEGEYVSKEGKDSGEHKKVSTCKKDSLLNPMKWISIFYWAAIVSGGIALVLNIVLVFKPSAKLINWTCLFLGGAVAMMLVGSVVSHGVAEAASKLINFVGEGLSISAIAGKTFINTTWVTTFLLMANMGLLWFARWRINKHPEMLTSGGSSSAGIPYSISRPMQQSSGAESVQMNNFGAVPDSRFDRTYDSAATIHMPAAPELSHPTTMDRQPAFGVRGRNGSV